MRKIKNPYNEIDGYNCFGCSAGNGIGLHMEFREEGDEVVCEWQPKRQFEGYHNVLHGGIQATLMDEIASWYIQVKLKTAGVTSKLETRYKKPVSTIDGPIIIRSKLKESKRNLAYIDVTLYNSNGELCTECEAVYFVFPQETALRKFYYPGFDSFFDED